VTDRERFARLQALAPDADAEVADWYAAALDPGWSTLCSFVPRGFAAYARILHAPMLEDVEVHWADVARERGTELHARAEWVTVAERGPGLNGRKGWPGDDPAEGSLTRRELATLVDTLGPFAHGPVLAGVWVGYGQLPGAWLDLPVAEQPGREYYYFRRSLDQIVTLSRDLVDVGRVEAGQGGALLRAGRPGLLTRFRGPRPTPEMPHVRFAHPELVQSPNQWWAEDRSWAVATEIDLDSTWVGGSEELVAAVLDHPELEAFRADPDAPQHAE
jgi:hypothetical protein